jgi:Family of unknown function (DUF6444)
VSCCLPWASSDVIIVCPVRPVCPRTLLKDKDAKITELEAKLARLERLISRNSGNSSMPPSGDDQPGKTPPKQKPGRGAGKRKPGKQPGAYLAWDDHPEPDREPVPGRELRVRYGPEGCR